MPSGEIKRRAGRKTRPPSLLEKITAYQKVIRDLDLTLHEWALLTVVVDRTIGWGKPHREITLEELTTSCRISARSVRRASAGLVKAGLVEVLFTGRTNRYGVTEAMSGSLKLPKRLKGEEPQPGQWGRSGWPEGRASYKNNTPRGDETIQKTIPPPNGGECALPRARSRPRPETPEAATAGVVDKAAKKRKRDIHMKTVPAAFRSWKEAHAECGFSTPMGWGYTGEKKAGRMNGIATVLVDAFEDAADLHTFINWVVYQWRTDILKHFHWMTDFPSMPSLGLVVRHLEDVVVLWRGGGVKVGEEWRDGPHAEEIEDLLMDGNSERAKELMRAT